MTRRVGALTAAVPVLVETANDVESPADNEYMYSPMAHTRRRATIRASPDHVQCNVDAWL